MTTYDLKRPVPVVSRKGAELEVLLPLYKQADHRGRAILSPAAAIDSTMLRVLLCSILAALVTGRNDLPQKTCIPTEETIVVTTTAVNFTHDQVTEYDFKFGHQSLDVTSLILVPSTLIETQTLTSFSGPEIATSTSYVTDTIYQTEYQTSLATVVATHTSRVLATEVEVEELTITQTAIVDHTVTETLVVNAEETAFRTVTVTENVNAFDVETEVSTFYVTETSYQTVTQFATDVVTSFTEQTVQATVTVTEHEYVTKCHQPKVTYDN